jgi:hypothetical protein
MDNSGWNMYVFRDGRKIVAGESVRRTLLDALRAFLENPTEDTRVTALIAAGELECALADADSQCAPLACEVTSTLAEAFVAERECESLLLEQVRTIRVPDEVRIAVAEGFAYYALHPHKFVGVIQQLELPRAVRVMGLRSIGTTLSAVVTAALRARGIAAERMTVRPHGHPYERQLNISEQERDWLLAGEDAHVFVVDEGPGISGSSFLATAEAVEACGIDAERIVMLGSREPRVEQLRAPRAPERWKRFRFLAVNEHPLLPCEAQQELSGGLWRRLVLTDFENQPASWTQLECSKYLGADRSRMFKFHGYGHYGQVIGHRAQKLAEAGFSPRAFEHVRGFGQYEFLCGRVLTREDLSPALLQRMAEYCAVRKSEFVTDESVSDLEAMVSWNWECEFGRKLEMPLELDTKHKAIVDGRMMPHEWLLTDDGRVLKTDAVSHGDDHFFPGPCDVAWDVAGAVIEWELSEAEAAEFVDQYRVLSGDDVRDRLPEYLLAYATFRMAWSKMAAQASAGQFDEELLMRDYRKYREIASEAEKGRTAKQASAKVA